MIVPQIAFALYLDQPDGSSGLESIWVSFADTQTVRALHSTAQLILTRVQGSVAKATAPSDIQMEEAVANEQPAPMQVIWTHQCMPSSQRKA